MEFKIGQKIVCIEPYKWYDFELKKDQIYTVKEIIKCNCGSLKISVGLTTATNCSVCDCGHITSQLCHRANRFRPLDDKFADKILENIRHQLIDEELFTYL